MNKKRTLIILMLCFIPLFHLSTAGDARANTSETIYFDPYAATPTLESIQTLERIKQQLTNDASLQVLIEGHADSGEVREGEKDAGAYLRNLSRMRADFVSNWIKSALNRQDMKNTVSAFGPDRPADKAQPAKNRRVTLRLYTKNAPDEQVSATNDSGEAPTVFVPEMVHTFKDALENTKVTHDYVIKNTGTGILEILKVKPG